MKSIFIFGVCLLRLLEIGWSQPNNSDIFEYKQGKQLSRYVLHRYLWKVDSKWTYVNWSELNDSLRTDSFAYINYLVPIDKKDTNLPNFCNVQYYLWNSFWERFDFRNAGDICADFTIGQKSMGIYRLLDARQIRIPKGYISSYKVKCVKIKQVATKTYYKFYFYPTCNFGYSKRKGYLYHIRLPISVISLKYLHNVGFISIKEIGYKTKHLHTINGIKWREYISKTNPSFEYFSKKTKVF